VIRSSMSIRPHGYVPLFAATALWVIGTSAPRAAAPPHGIPPAVAERRAAVLENEAAWKKLPARIQGTRQPLPMWARALAATLPHTTAAMLELDYLHRVRSPLAPGLRARLRWAAAHALDCRASEACALADLRRAGLTESQVQALSRGQADPDEAQRPALAFARKVSLDPHTVTDEEVAGLLRRHGEKQVVAMVLLLAYANFQDRLLLALDLPQEPNGPLPAVAVRFAAPELGASLAVPRKHARGLAAPPRLATDREWRSLNAAALREEMQKQRSRRPRIRLPKEGPGAIHWGAVCHAYQPELAAAWAACRQRFEAESDQDPVFAASVFWVVARGQRSFY
jgi:alkylhydroperoxidase family enzyme